MNEGIGGGKLAREGGGFGDSRNKCHGYGTVHSGYVGSVCVERLTRAVWKLWFDTTRVAGRVSLTIKCPVRT